MATRKQKKRTKYKKSVKPRSVEPVNTGRESKQAKVIELLRRPKGATVEELAAATGWQQHSVRGVLSAALKKRLGLNLLVFDMYGVGLHNPKIAAAVNQFMQERRSLVEAIVRGVIAGMPEPPQTTAEAIAGAIYGALLGITLEKLIDRKFDADKAIDALAEMVFTFARLPVPAEGL